MLRQVVQVQPQSTVQEEGQWSTGLCECYKDMGDCCFALCCLPVFTCKVTSAVGACPCLPLLDCIGCVPPASLAMRASVRERYAITACTTSFCGPCTWCQIARGSQMRKNTITFVNMSQYESLTETLLPSFMLFEKSKGQMAESPRFKPRGSNPPKRDKRTLDDPLPNHMSQSVKTGVGHRM
uniref:Plac8 onzin related protein 3 n=1 Tax=Pundamilia nyererei TaxID=303518 RepID=A0A3B4GJ98_9CICH